MLPRRLDGNAAGIEANALADESHRPVATLAAVPAHDHGAAGPRRALGDPEQRAHPELGHRLDVENLDTDAKLAQLAGAAREFLGKKHVRRLVDEIARGDDALDDMGVGRKGLARVGDVADRERNIRPQCRLLAVLLLGLVAVELVGAQPQARSDRGRLPGLHRPVRQFRDDRHGFLAGQQLAGGHPAKLEEVVILQGRQLAGADHDQARGLEALRGQNIERGPVFALELVGGGRPGDQIGGLAQRLAGRRPEFQRIIAKNHQNAARGG